ncbi:MAG: FtsQ-type POTRA domain-containing protein [Rhizomicrobium sp.]|jgi:cell division protein FtsQ
MRSVKAERKPRRNAAKRSGRRGVAAVRVAPERPAFGKRMRFRNDPFSRFFREVKRRLTFRRPMLALTVALLLLTGIAALFAGGKVHAAVTAGQNAVSSVVADAGFGIRAVHLAGNHRTQPQMIINALGFEPGQSIFAADVQGARRRLLALDWVADAEVSRQYPDSISVSLVEKLPFALWQAANGVYVIERSGRVITLANPAEFSRLPYLIGDGAPLASAELVDAVAQHRAVSARVRAYRRMSERRWDLILEDGVVVQLPEDNWAKELDVLEHLIVDKGVLERDISEIDLRQRDNFFFVLKNGDRQPVARGNAT